MGRAAALQFAGEGAQVLLADRDKEAVVGQMVGFFGGVAVLVHTSGITDLMSGPADTDDAEWRRVLEVNRTAPLLPTRAVLPHMPAEEHGVTLFAASEAGVRGGAADVARTTAEHGVRGLVKSLAVMYRRAREPGERRHHRHRSAGRRGPRAHGPGVLPPCLGLSGRAADPDEQAAVMLFLASEDACRINGVVLPVDNRAVGGLTWSPWS
ncbi:SDR family oxidoreductase [Streptomyces sp. NPDC019531]|uniref:SDR family oxidoreductase n=1 Tax=Streptomyces sp. NPDC019531 TaxID=3365062 RepID=UPI0038515463